ncbi:MAG: methyl-accepting chemotaxis protein [Candidatus Gastranaerophilales bacterium]|nr:methyl-accepting chemotaxis protein [Candidatus Gastranaerophilales bacterium]
MFNNLKLGVKIAAGFAAILILSTVLGGFCVFSMKNAQIQSGKLSNEYVPVAAIANNIQKNTLLGMLDIRSYGLSEEDHYYTTGKAFLDKAQKSFKEIIVLIDKYPSLINLKDNAVNAETSLNDYDQLVDETKSIVDNKKVLYIELVKTGSVVLNDFNTAKKSGNLSIRESANDALILMYAVRLAALRSKASNDPQFLQAAVKDFDSINQYISRMKGILDAQFIEKITAGCNKYKADMFAYGQSIVKLQEIGKKRNVIWVSVLDLTQKIAEKSTKSTQSTASTSAIALAVSSTLMIFGLIAAIVIGAILAWLIVVGITKPINKIIEGLRDSSEQVTSASGQLSSSSQILAEGSAEQASSIEETSSTLEESASMIRQNTENTRQAALLARKTKESADKGNKEMSDMMTSMGELKKSSDQIAKIIKVIDDIAFQTNILALNAAVEAARAGEAGMGFAVVAEEVRNLAQRSAQAAKDTASIIESNIELSEKGVDVSAKVNESLVDIFNESQKVNDLIDEIAAASQEQAQGIAQINKAISQMEQVVQTNAATAEESAAASEELSSQAMNMKDIVNSLVHLVNGASVELNKINYRTLSDINKVTQNNYSGKLNKRKNIAQSNFNSSYNKNTQIVNPEDVIPLENDTKGF